VNARDRQIAVLTASGFTAAEAARKLGVGVRSVERARARPEVQDLIRARERDGISPRDVLAALLYSPNEQTRMRAAIELAKMPPDPGTERAAGQTVVYAPPAVSKAADA
jgi:hypothetical protein